MRLKGIPFFRPMQIWIPGHSLHFNFCQEILFIKLQTVNSDYPDKGIIPLSSIQGVKMNANTILKAVDLGKRMKHVFVATADNRGLPHLAAAGTIRIVSENQIAIEAWFCPGTLQNILCNPMISVVAWDPATDIGHQILGKMEKIEDIAILDGFSPDIETGAQLPQSERRLIVRVDKVLAFSHAPHSDVVE
jgi:hypothetical protein